MLLRLIRMLVHFRAIVLGLSALFVACAAWVTWRTPIDVLPDLSENQVLVYTPWPTHFPEEIDRLITRPLSGVLQTTDGIRSVRGSSDVGWSLIHVIFDDQTSFREARERVAARLRERSLELPPQVSPQLAPAGIATGQILWYTVEAQQSNLTETRIVQEQVVAPELRRITGVAEVATVGGFTPQLRIDARAEDLLLAKVDWRELVGAVTRALSNSSGRSNDDHSRLRSLSQRDAAFDPAASSNKPPNSISAGESLGSLPITLTDGRTVRLRDFADITPETALRYGAFERDGSEAVAGVVHLEHGANTLAVTQALLASIDRINDRLVPQGFRVATCYDRRALIHGAIWTIVRTVLECILVTTLTIYLVMRHWRSSLVIVLGLIVTILAVFLSLGVGRRFNLLDVQTNLMSLAGIAISIGVLVDASIVIVDNVTHRLREQFGELPVAGDTDELVSSASAAVASPMCLAIMLMLVSFLPVFALRGVDGKIFAPLAWTKTLAMLTVAILSVTLIPVLCRVLIRGKLRSEHESRILRWMIDIYRPCLEYLFDRPFPLICFLTFILLGGAIVSGSTILVATALSSAIGMHWLGPVALSSTWQRALASAGLLLLAAIGPELITPIRAALRLPLNEGMIMDMPITLPKIGIEAATNDLKARNMTLCRFPEVRMVAGKVGRAETAFDPAPIDMIESMIEFQPESRWPRRRLEPTAAGRITQKIIDGLVKENLIVPPVEEAALAEQVTNEALRRLDAVQREFCWQLQQAFRAEARRLLALEAVEQWAARRTSGGGPATPMPALQVASLVDQLPRADLDRLFMRCDQTALHVVLLEVQRLLDTVDGLPIAQDLHTDSATDMRIDPRSIEALEASILRAVQRAEQRAWDAHLAQTNRALALRIGPTYLQLVLDELLARVVVRDSKFADYWDQVLDVRSRANDQATVHHTGTHRLMVDSLTRLPMIDPYPTFNRWRSDMLRRIERDIRLVPQTAEALTATDGELDTALKVPGWANVWTRPIQNRIDMLATGVNAEIGIRVSGPELSLVVDTSERIAAVVSQLPGAQNPIADPIRGKEYFALRVDDERAAARSVNPDDAQIAFALATSGQLVGRWTDRDQEFSVRLLLTGHSPSGPVEPLAIPIARATGVSSDPRDGATADPWIRLGQIATVESFDGPATIKSENGLIRNYVRLNVVGRSPKDFVDEAKLAIAQTVPLPPGVMVAWSGQFEHAQQTRRLLLWIIPTALLLIAGLLWLAFRDLADAGTMFLSVPLAIAGGAICQWMLGIPFSLAVAIGYLACLGMAATTSMIMLVYLRDSLAKCGDLSRISELELRTAVIDGAVQRLRPKFLTEATTIIGLAPVLWSTGLGSDVIRPMAVPVLGGILIADEVVDLLIPLVFYQVRRRRKQHLPEPVFADRKRELE